MAKNTPENDFIVIPNVDIGGPDAFGEKPRCQSSSESKAASVR